MDGRAVSYIRRMLDSGYSSQLIYSELLKEGYSENEISSAFRAVYSEMEKAEAVQEAMKGGKTAPKIPVKILVPVLLGVIAVVMIIFVVPLSLFSAGPAPANTEFFAPESPQAQQEFQPPPAFEAPQEFPAACKDILPDSDFENIVSPVSEFQFDEKTTGAPGIDSTLACTYVNDFDDGKAGNFLAVTVTVTWYPEGSLAGTVERLYQGVKKYQENSQDLPGLGSASYTEQDGSKFARQIITLSTNKKYHITVGVNQFSEIVDAFAIAQELTRVVDQNLNRP